MSRVPIPDFPGQPGLIHASFPDKGAWQAADDVSPNWMKIDDSSLLAPAEQKRGFFQAYDKAQQQYLPERQS
jgi:hypothetical protein